MSRGSSISGLLAVIIALMTAGEAFAQRQFLSNLGTAGIRSRLAESSAEEKLIVVGILDGLVELGCGFHGERDRVGGWRSALLRGLGDDPTRRYGRQYEDGRQQARQMYGIGGCEEPSTVTARRALPNFILLLNAFSPPPPTEIVRLTKTFSHGERVTLTLTAGDSTAALYGAWDDWCRASASVSGQADGALDVFAVQDLVSQAGAFLEAECPAERLPEGYALPLFGEVLPIGGGTSGGRWRRVVYSTSNWMVPVLATDRPRAREVVAPTFASDIRPTVERLRASAKTGDPVARRLLGAYFEHAYTDATGRLSPQYDSAAALYRQAAAQGNAGGMMALALLHDAGLGVIMDDVARDSLLKQAAELEHPRAMVLAGKVVWDSEDVSSVVASHVLGYSVPLYAKAASLGDSTGRAEMAAAYLKTRYTLVLLSNDESYHALFAAQVNRLAPLGFPRTTAQALTILADAAANGYCPALNRLGRTYFRGEGVDRDLNAAARWLVQVEGCPGAREIDRAQAKWMLAQALGGNPPPAFVPAKVAIESQWGSMGQNTAYSRAIAAIFGTLLVSAILIPDDTPVARDPNRYPGSGLVEGGIEFFGGGPASYLGFLIFP